jgi:hypothetical protein
MIPQLPSALVKLWRPDAALTALLSVYGDSNGGEVTRASKIFFVAEEKAKVVPPNRLQYLSADVSETLFSMLT